MNNCKNCNADPQVCEYCIYKKNKNSINNSDNNEKIIYYYNIKKYAADAKRYLLTTQLFLEKIIKV